MTLISPCHSDLEFENLVRAISRKMLDIRSLYMVGTLGRGYRCATSWGDLDLTFDLYGMLQLIIICTFA